MSQRCSQPEAMSAAVGSGVGDAAFVGPNGSMVWLVTGSNGENQIRAEGPTELEAWQAALEQARAVEMLRV